MKTLLTLIAISCCLAFHVDASIVAAPPTYAGSYPLPVGSDVVVAAYGLRRLTPSYAATTKFVNVQRASDNATQDIGTVNGYDFDTATFTTFCAATTCRVKRWYDQSGNGADAIQATFSAMPQLLLNQKNGHPALVYTAATSIMIATLASGITGGSYVMVGQTPSNVSPSPNPEFLVDLGPSSGFSDNEGLQLSAATCSTVRNNGTPATANLACVASTWYRWVMRINNSLARLSQTGVQATDATTTGGIATTTSLNVGSAIQSASFGWGGSFAELIVLSPDVSDTDSAYISANQSGYWGI